MAGGGETSWKALKYSGKKLGQGTKLAYGGVKTVSVFTTEQAVKASKSVSGQRKHVRKTTDLIGRLSDALTTLETVMARQAARITELEAENARLRQGR